MDTRKHASREKEEYTESSLPGFRTTLKRGIPFPNVFDWLEVKRRDDNIGKHWRVHDKLYNLEKFVNIHPGGRDWLRFTQGIDITEAFEASHPHRSNEVEKVLEKYYVQDATTLRNSPYTFKEDGFYKTLKRRVAPIIKEMGMDYSTEVLLLQDSLALGYISLAVWSVISNSFQLQILAGILLGMCSIGGHNFLHKADNWRQYYFDLCPLSSFEFRISHAFSHHLYPNTILDFEVLLSEPMIKYLPRLEKNFVQRYLAPFYTPLLFTIFTMTQLICRCYRFAKGTQELRPENLIILTEFIMMVVLAPSVMSGITSFLTIVMIGSLWFVFVGFAHHHNETWHDGDEARPDADFGLSQLDATQGKTNWYHEPLIAVLTTFGQHPMHHLFPTVCHSKLKLLKPVVEQVLSEFCEKFPQNSQFQLFLGAQRQMGRIYANPWNRDNNNGMK